MRKIFFACALLLGNGVLLASSEPVNPAHLLMTLKPRQPNWRFEVVEAFPQGNPKKITFYEPTLEGERPVKQLVFYENSSIQSEVDVVQVDEESQATKEWGSTLVPHGTRVEFSPEGKVAKVGNYQWG